MENKTITIENSDGAYDYASFFFSHKGRKKAIKKFPKFYSFSASNFDFDKYKKDFGAPFVLDSIMEYQRGDVEHWASYKVVGEKIIKK